MLATRGFFDRNPEYIEKVVLIQICIGKSSDPDIKRSLEMSPEEKGVGGKLFKSVIEHDSDNWITKCFEYINNAWESNQETSTVFNLAPENSVLITKPPKSIYLSSRFQNLQQYIQSLYNGVLNIGLIAENGAYVRVNGSWYNIVEELDWMKEVVKDLFDEKVERLPGSYYKIADSMIRFHTENADDQDRVPTVIGEAITHINTLFDDRDIHAYVHKDIVFVQQNGASLSRR
nr:BPK_HP1_G0042830.mRNA.1.CDS.1 [Saccharomyces cerevisiae]